MKRRKLTSSEIGYIISIGILLILIALNWGRISLNVNDSYQKYRSKIVDKDTISNAVTK